MTPNDSARAMRAARQARAQMIGQMTGRAVRGVGTVALSLLVLMIFGARPLSHDERRALRSER